MSSLRSLHLVRTDDKEINLLKCFLQTCFQYNQRSTGLVKPLFSQSTSRRSADLIHHEDEKLIHAVYLPKARSPTGPEPSNVLTKSINPSALRIKRKSGASPLDFLILQILRGTRGKRRCEWFWIVFNGGKSLANCPSGAVGAVGASQNKTPVAMAAY